MTCRRGATCARSSMRLPAAARRWTSPWRCRSRSTWKMPAEVTPRRFPPPWTVEEKDTYFIVRDNNRHALAYAYFEIEQGRRTQPIC